MATTPLTVCWGRVQMDALRWIEPEQIAAPHELTPTAFLKVLVRHMSLRAVVWYRLAYLCRELGIRGVPSWICRRIHRVYGMEVSPILEAEGGLYVAHPVGCVLHARHIGENVTIVGQATFGMNRGGWATIGARAYIGVGARILGNVIVGEDARVGANAVVLSDVPPGTTAVGVPARLIEPRSGPGTSPAR